MTITYALSHDNYLCSIPWQLPMFFSMTIAYSLSHDNYIYSIPWQLPRLFPMTITYALSHDNYLCSIAWQLPMLHPMSITYALSHDDYLYSFPWQLLIMFSHYSHSKISLWQTSIYYDTECCHFDMAIFPGHQQCPFHMTTWQLIRALTNDSQWYPFPMKTTQSHLFRDSE